MAGSTDDAMERAALLKERTRAEFLQITAPLRKQLMGSTRTAVKDIMLDDADMWRCVRDAYGSFLDHLWSDIEREVERNLQVVLLKQQADAEKAGPGFLCGFGPLRRFVLRHYLPHNKSMFGKFNDPVYWVIFLLSCLPVHGLRVVLFSIILLMLIFPCPPDEFQLINFILLSKGIQFLTSGLLQSWKGALTYFWCYSAHKDDLLACIDTYGPGATGMRGQALDYLGSIVLVWIAFSLLSRSQQHALRKGDAEENRQGAKTAGGRLQRLLRYDVKCFLVSIILLTVLTLWTSWDELSNGGSLAVVLRSSQFGSNVFWCCVLYSILSLPFALFTIPGLQTILVHCDPTGFNEQGACVAYALPSMRVADEPAGGKTRVGFTRMAGMATRVLKVVERGREARGASAPEEDFYRFGDFTRGILARTKKTDAAPASALSSTGSAGSKTPCGTEPYTAEVGGGFLAKLRGNRAKDPVSGPSIPLAAIRIGKESMEERTGGVWFFGIEAIPEGSLDAESGGEAPWFVWRRFREFDHLANKLGHRSRNYPDAPFPMKHLKSRQGADPEQYQRALEDRRQALEVWLNRVVQDSFSEGKKEALRVFLKCGGEAEKASTVSSYASFMSDACAPSTVTDDAFTVASFLGSIDESSAEPRAQSSTDPRLEEVPEDASKSASSRDGHTTQRKKRHAFGDVTRAVWSKAKASIDEKVSATVATVINASVGATASAAVPEPASRSAEQTGLPDQSQGHAGCTDHARRHAAPAMSNSSQAAAQPASAAATPPTSSAAPQTPADNPRAPIASMQTPLASAAAPPAEAPAGVDSRRRHSVDMSTGGEPPVTASNSLSTGADGSGSAAPTPAPPRAPLS